MTDLKQRVNGMTELAGVCQVSRLQREGAAELLLELTSWRFDSGKQIKQRNHVWDGNFYYKWNMTNNVWWVLLEVYKR